jgi:uncharacterized membrane protein YdjX (TVP38/TMEM64 family)
VNTHIFGMLGGGVFILGALLGVIKGSIPLKAGGAIEKHNDPFGFWAAIVCLTVVGLFIIWIEKR